MYVRIIMRYLSRDDHATTSPAISPMAPSVSLSACVLCYVILLRAYSFGQLCANLDADVLILGAGMAGISAGKTLSDDGIDNFLILEGGDDIGGRVKNTEFGGVTIELGANWIQGLFSNGSTEKNPLWPLKTQFNLEGNITNFFDLVVYDTDGMKVNENELNKLVRDINATVEFITEESERRQLNKKSDLKLLSALRFAGWKPQSVVEQFIEWFRTDFCFAEGPEVTSLFANYPEYTYDTFGPFQFFVSDQRGYATIISGLANEYLTPNYRGDPRLRLNEVVKKIEWKECCVCATVENSTGSNYTYCAKTAIHTFSLGTLQAGTVEFVPPLPEEKRLAINVLDMAYYLKVFVHFPHSFWDDSEYIGYGSYGRGYYPLFQPLDVGNGKFFPSNPPILLMTVTGREALRVSSQPKNTTLSEIHQVLKTMYGDSVPAPIDILVPDWIQNPLFHGMYSNCPPDFTDEIFTHFREPSGTLVFSGEATDENSSGFVHGAYNAGIDGAKQAEKFLSQCPSQMDSGSDSAGSGESKGHLFVILLALASVVLSL